MESLTPQLIQLLDQGRPFARALILSHQGSTPRTPGSAMLVTQDGEIFGTIGGGKLEGMAIEACRELIPTGKSRIQTFDLGLAPGQNSAPLAQDLDMICGGSLTLFMEVITPTPQLREEFTTRRHLESQGIPGFWISRLQGCSQGEFTTTSTLLTQGKEVPDLPPALIQSLSREKITIPRILGHGLGEFIVEPIRPLDTLYILGGGHVGYCLYHIAAMADFRVAVVDDREEFANPIRFPHAQCRVIPNFDNLAGHLGPLGAGAYVVILTRGHRFDLTALDQILALERQAGLPLPYIGMIGSRTKRDKIYGILENQGTPKAVLDRVHSPVGLSIGAETPAEIAVSIMAEIIQIRAGA